MNALLIYIMVGDAFSALILTKRLCNDEYPRKSETTIDVAVIALLLNIAVTAWAAVLYFGARP